MWFPKELFYAAVSFSNAIKKEKPVDSGKTCGALMTDLLKAFDCLNHELLIVTLNACGFSLPTLKLIHDYLSNKKQRTKINSFCGSWHKIILAYHKVLF